LKGVARIRDAKTDRLVGAVCEEMVGRLGGFHGFLEAWTGCMARDVKRGGFAAFRHFDCIIRLMQFRESQRPDCGTWTDEQLEAAISAGQISEPGHPEGRQA
jgi:hypothetical protein